MTDHEAIKKLGEDFARGLSEGLKETPDKRTENEDYVKLPSNHIVIDFDLKDDNGEKSLERNLEEASKWPETYGELSKSENGIHLHYIYSGDPDARKDEQRANEIYRLTLSHYIESEDDRISIGEPLVVQMIVDRSMAPTPICLNHMMDMMRDEVLRRAVADNEK